MLNPNNWFQISETVEKRLKFLSTVS